MTKIITQTLLSVDFFFIFTSDSLSDTCTEAIGFVSPMTASLLLIFNEPAFNSASEEEASDRSGRRAIPNVERRHSLSQFEQQRVRSNSS
jgi:hypothetical protein